MDTVGALLERIAVTLPESRAALRRLKTELAASSGSPLIRNDALLHRYRDEVASGLRQPDVRLERILTLNSIRSQSGIATVTVITKPYACPGRCVYCPTEARAPKSYLTNEPAVMRALRSDYDPYRQVGSRLEALEQTGHPTDKVELIIKGGTWSFYPKAYQEWFVSRCFEAANDFARGSRLKARDSGRGAGGGGTRPLVLRDIPQSALRNPQSDPPPQHDTQPPRTTPDPASLEAVQRRNETAASRLVGVTIETRPDYVTPEEIRRLRRLGVTRVELGVQTLDESALALTVRDHGTAEIRCATRLLKDTGFKVAYHLMPNLPGATPAGDLASARRLFDDPDYRPDALKLYPCVVIESAELYRWWREGRYTPYGDEALLELLIAIKQLVPPYVRIERVIRDIPSSSILAGCRLTNLREAAQRRMRERGLRCRCIRCRQVRTDGAGSFTLTRRDYDASGGRETFLSFEDRETDRLAALLRLRIADPQAEPPGSALRGAALIREVHSYGLHVPLHGRQADAVQHRGFGRRLMEAAEQIARDECGMTRVAVIAGVGVREYYRALGYALEDTYMIKRLARRPSAAAPEHHHAPDSIPDHGAWPSGWTGH